MRWKTTLLTVLFYLSSPFLLSSAAKDTDDKDSKLWEKDMTNDVYIEASTDGFEFVHLDCNDDNMEVSITLEEPFDGIFYTRGSFQSAKAPCFFDATGEEKLTLRIPFDDCQTSEKDGAYINTVILQHDDWLIFPGDSAFEVSCNKTTRTDFPVAASIGLADPDPAAKELPKHRKSTVTAEGKAAEFRPGDIRPRNKKKTTKKDEL